MDALHRLAQGLLERETLDKDEIELVIQGKPLPVLVPNPEQVIEAPITDMPLVVPKTEVA